MIKSEDMINTLVKLHSAIQQMKATPLFVTQSAVWDESDNLLAVINTLRRMNNAPENSVMRHIRTKIVELERATNGIVCLQFSNHPEGIGMVVRVHIPVTGKEFSFPDVVLPSEPKNIELEKERIDVLFDIIHEALGRVQVIKSGNLGIIQ